MSTFAFSKSVSLGVWSRVRPNWRSRTEYCTFAPWSQDTLLQGALQEGRGREIGEGTRARKGMGWNEGINKGEKEEAKL